MTIRRLQNLRHDIKTGFEKLERVKKGYLKMSFRTLIFVNSEPPRCICLLKPDVQSVYFWKLGQTIAIQAHGGKKEWHIGYANRRSDNSTFRTGPMNMLSCPNLLHRAKPGGV